MKFIVFTKVDALNYHQIANYRPLLQYFVLYFHKFSSKFHVNMTSFTYSASF